MDNNLFFKNFLMEPFHVSFNIIAYNDERSFIEYCINQGIKLDDNTVDMVASSYVHCSGSNIYIIFYINELDNIGTIAHESIHAVDKMFQAIGQPDYTILNDELIPYYTSFIVNQVIEFLKENNFLSLIFNLQANEK